MAVRTSLFLTVGSAPCVDLLLRERKRDIDCIIASRTSRVVIDTTRL